MPGNLGQLADEQHVGARLDAKPTGADGRTKMGADGVGPRVWIGLAAKQRGSVGAQPKNATDGAFAKLGGA